jgi:hypothetical protein
MAWLKTVWSEFLALAILIWLGAAWFILPRLGQSAWPPVVLFAGLAAILLDSVLREARRPR